MKYTPFKHFFITGEERIVINHFLLGPNSASTWGGACVSVNLVGHVGAFAPLGYGTAIDIFLLCLLLLLQVLFQVWVLVTIYDVFNQLLNDLLGYSYKFGGFAQLANLDQNEGCEGVNC